MSTIAGEMSTIAGETAVICCQRKIKHVQELSNNESSLNFKSVYFHCHGFRFNVKIFI